MNIIEVSDYKIFDDCAVSTKTGEISEAINILAPVGTVSYTPDQQEAYKKRKELEESKRQRREQGNELGNFYFISKDHELGKISTETVGRLIYLLTYLNYENTFMLTERTPMKKKDLKKIMNVSDRTVDLFWNEINHLYVEECDGLLKLVNKDIIRGKLLNNHEIYQKLYIVTIRELYLNLEPTKHRYLGYIFQTLPYINIEYNVLCKNPYETNLDLIEPLSVGEFCKYIGFNKSNFHRLRKTYNEITFDVKGNEQYFLSFVLNGNNLNDTQMFVNPRILYSGSDYKKVEVLGMFCKRN